MSNLNKWYMYNVVCYDGVDSWVIKFIAHEDSELCHNEVQHYMQQFADVEVVKVDGLYPMTTEQIIEFYNMPDGGEHSSQEKQYKAAHVWAEMF